jgi:hypothetical protein
MPSYLRFTGNVVTPKVVIIAAAAVNAANQLGFEGPTTITSANDGVHQKGSFHYVDRALDFRTHHLTHDQKHAWLAATKIRLGSEYDVLLEDEDKPNEHMHAEWDPQKANHT